MKYYQLDNYYFALNPDRENPQSYMCRITPLGENMAQVCSGKAAEHQCRIVQSRESKEEISVEEFQKKFSEAVDCLHNNTPFA